MRRRCSPEFYARSYGGGWCGRWFDDAERSTICPHPSLSGGDKQGLGVVPSMVWDDELDRPLTQARAGELEREQRRQAAVAQAELLLTRYGRRRRTVPLLGITHREALLWLLLVVGALVLGAVTAPGAPLGWCWGGCR